MSISQNTYAQSSFNLYGYAGNYNSPAFRLNSFESNPANYSVSKDWELSALFGSTVAAESAGNIYLISLGKRIGGHYLYSRFTPGFESKFVFNTGTSILISDTSEVETTLKTNLSYSEKFGFGYSFNFSENFSAGFSIRYFDQKFTEETAVPVFTDTLNSIVTESAVVSKNYWRGEIGITYNANDNLSIGLSSINLFTVKENSGDESLYEMAADKGLQIVVNYSPLPSLNLHTTIESTSGIVGGANYSFDFLGGKLSAGFSLIHGKNFESSIAGIIPSINYSTGLFSISLSGVKYLSENEDNLRSTFLEKKFNSVVNNQYSEDRVFLGVNFSLSFEKEKSVKLIEVEIKNEIFPTLEDNYINEPFAVGKVINISDKIVTVKPSSIIPGINSEIISSPPVNIPPGDTVLVPFYTIINNEEILFEKREISQANFYVTVLNGEPEDQIQKPVLINNYNSWDGRVKNLKYFATKDFGFSNKFAKNILNEEKEKLDSAKIELKVFEQIKILFSKFVKEMIYVSDPRSSVEYVQFPEETIKVKGGDCDDLSVGFASLLESIGIETAFVDYKSEEGISHVNLLINTKLEPPLSRLITVNDKKYFIREDESGNDKIWIPLEMTSLTDFETAWNSGSEKFYKEAVEDLGLAKSKVEIIDIR